MQVLDVFVVVVAAALAIGLLVYRARRSECHSVGECKGCPHAQQCGCGTCGTREVKTLDRLVKGDRFSIVDVLDDEVRCQLVRFGVEPGQSLYCDYVLPGGPIIVKRGRQQIAIGRNLAERVRVEVYCSDEA
jgi:Fe2+ transport system protein FeoA